MPFDGSGNFNRVMNWVADRDAAIKIRADRHDQEDDNFASGLSNVITKDGQTQPTNNIPMNGKRIVNLGAPVNPTDAATKAYTDAVKPFTTGVEISGANANGRLKFTSATGINGLSFTGADLGFLARLAGTPSGALARLVLNTKPDGSGTDVITFNDNGSASFAAGVTAGGTIVGNSIVEVRSAGGGTAHFRIATPDGSEERMLLYTTTGATAGNVGLRVDATQTFTFMTNGQFRAPGAVYAGTALLNTNGNPYGTIWDAWGADNAFAAISARIEARATAWANDRVGKLQYRKASQGRITGGSSTDANCPAGAVLTGFNRQNSGDLNSMLYHYLQVYDPVRGWVGFTG